MLQGLFSKRTGMVAWSLVVLFVGLLALGGVASAQESLRIILPTGGTYTERDQTAMVQRFIDERPGVDVEIEFVGWDGLWDRIVTSVASGNAPDVMYIGTRWVPVLADLGAIVPLDEYISDEKHSLYYDAVWDTVAYDDQLWGVVRAMSTKAIIYNKDIFAEAGVDIPTTWDELLAAAKHIDETTDAAGYGLPADPYVSTVSEWQNFLHGNDGEIVDADTFEATINSPKAVEAFEFYFRDLIQHAQSSPMEWRREDLIRLFNAGRIAMYTDNIFSAFDADELGVNVGVFPVPGGPSSAEPYGTVLITDAMAISSRSTNKELAMELINFLTSPEEQLAWDSNQGFIPPMPSEAEADVFQSSFWPPYIEAVKYGVPEAVNIYDWEATQEAILTAIHRYMLGQGEAQELLDEAAATINELQGIY